MTKIVTAQLPDKPSDLIDVALRDLERIELMPDRYKVAMMDWHQPGTYEDQGKCLVCMAGAVMAGTLGASPGENLSPSSYPEEMCGKLEAISEFMFGAVESGLHSMGVPVGEDDWNNRSHTPYRQSPERFKADMRQLAADLREKGL